MSRCEAISSHGHRCNRRLGHDGDHRARTGPPLKVENCMVQTQGDDGTWHDWARWRDGS